MCKFLTIRSQFVTLFYYPRYFSINWIYLLAALIPAVFLLNYIYKKDRVEKEPAGLLIKLLLGGILAALASIILEDLFQGILDSFLSYYDPLYTILLAFIVVAAVEESTKYFFLKIFSWRNRNFNYRFDGIVYAVFVSLGFAAFENILYVYNYGLSVALPRALLAVPAHMFFSVFMGLFYGRSKVCKVRRHNFAKLFNQILALLSAILLHGFYDVCLMLDTPETSMMFTVFVTIMYILVYMLIRKESKTDSYI